MRHVTYDQRLLPGLARRAVSRACRDAATGPQCEESTVLLTSEVVGNALVHGRGRVDVGVEAGPLSVRVEVGDEEPSHPHPAPAPALDGLADEGLDGVAECGRGLLIVTALSSAWGVADRADGGKNVWFEVPSQP